jgi:hypothetical protein
MLFEFIVIVLLAISSPVPNIAVEQYESSLSNEEWERQLAIMQQYDDIANPEDFIKAQQEDKDKWDKFMAEPHDGMMFKSDCNSVGVCDYYWEKPSLDFSVTNNDGEIVEISVTCGDGFYANYTAQECQLTKEQIVINEQIKQFLIAISILSIIVISGVIIYIKTKTDFDNIINIVKIYLKGDK